MLRKFAVSFAALLCSVASHVYALGLGNVTVESYLNQPLRVRIEVLELGDTQLEDISVQVASEDDYARNNLERVGFLSDVQFQIEASPDGAYVILSSNQNVREPDLSFILETRWPNGRLLSEHRIRLNLRVFEDQAPPATGLRRPVSPELREQDSADQSASPSPAAEPLGRRIIEISDADTLFSISRQVRPDASVTLQQTMLAIQALNPDAFIDGNINRLRSGQVLRVPSREEIETNDASTAASEVVRQNQAFADLQPLASPAQDEPDPQAESQAQLSVIAAEDAAVDSTSGAGEPDDEQNAELDRRIAELESQLALRQEEADRARLESEELDSRLADLEAQIETSLEIIRLQDMQLAQLQESLAEAAEEASLAATQAEIDAAQAQPAQDDIMRTLIRNNMVTLFGAALVILLLVGLLLWRNRAVAIDEEEHARLGQQNFASDREQVAAADAGPEQSVSHKAEADENNLEQELKEILVSGGGGAEMLTETGDAAGTENGIIAEADLLIQQQKYGKAASLLRQSLDADPDDHDVRLKLAEARALQEDLAAFEEQADVLEDERSSILDWEVSSVRKRLRVSSAATASEPPGAEESGYDAGTKFEGFVDREDAAGKSTAGPADSPEERKRDDDTASFLDDLGFGLDAFDADEFEFSDEIAKASDDIDKPAADGIDDDDASLGADLDMTFDLGAIEDLVDSQEQREDQQEDKEVKQQVAQTGSTKPKDRQTNDEIPLFDESRKVDGTAEKTNEVEEDELDDLGFLSDDEIEIESVDGVEEVNIMSDDDETATKLELAYAYQKMGDAYGAREILQEVIAEGNEAQAREARGLLAGLDDAD